MKLKILIIIILSCFEGLTAQENENIGKKFEANDSQRKKMELLNPSHPTLQQNLEMWESSRKVPNFSSHLRTGGEWQIAGPQGIGSNDFIFSGRIRDIDIVDSKTIRIAAASGGLWEITQQPDGTKLSKNLSLSGVNTPWSGAFATDPFDKNIILYGTGETFVRAGAGMWRTNNQGISWQKISMPTESWAYTDMAYTSIKGSVWCAGDGGIYFSKDSGLTWSQKKQGNISGLAIDYLHADTVLIAENNVGVFRSYNGGNTWSTLTNGLPTADIGRIEMSSCKSKPAIIYALISKRNNTTLGLYKSTNYGDSWVKCNIFNSNGTLSDIHWGMAYYCSFISVSPTNPNHVIAGGGLHIYTTDGLNFYDPEVAQHPDFHGGDWSEDGKTAFYCNDGGVYSTTFDQLWKWDQSWNNLPITQFSTLSVSKTKPGVMLGGTQDNGVVFYKTDNKKWYSLFGDGGGVAIDPTNENNMYAILGLFGGPLLFRNFKKTNENSLFWAEDNIGLYVSGQWGRSVKTDFNQDQTIITQTDNKVYLRKKTDEIWERYDFDELPSESI